MEQKLMTRRILIVDDEDDIREVARVSLELVAHWEVMTAARGQDAVEQARSGQPDAILLDVMMPGMDGPSTFAELQADPATRDIPVVFMTAKAQSADRARLERQGVAGVLTKPFDPMRLAADVAAALDWS
jgi:CheY-like chemotaxis protein